MKVPLAGVVIWLLGSDSQMSSPGALRMNLYWTLVLAGRFTVTAGEDVRHEWHGS